MAVSYLLSILIGQILRQNSLQELVYKAAAKSCWLRCQDLVQSLLYAVAFLPSTSMGFRFDFTYHMTLSMWCPKSWSPFSPLVPKGRPQWLGWNCAWERTGTKTEVKNLRRWTNKVLGCAILELFMQSEITFSQFSKHITWIWSAIWISFAFTKSLI